jgi:hypothetical protein
VPPDAAEPENLQETIVFDLMHDYKLRKLGVTVTKRAPATLLAPPCGAEKQAICVGRYEKVDTNVRQIAVDTT